MVNTGSLSVHDAADGTTDGIIKTIVTDQDTGAWSFQETGIIYACTEDSAEKETRALISSLPVSLNAITTLDDLELYLINLTKLDDLDAADGESDHSISLLSAMDQGLEDQWTITFGHLADNLANVQFSCAV